MSSFLSRTGQIPPVTRNLIIINLLVWLACFLFRPLGEVATNHLGLHYVGGSKFNPVQVITYMFMHDYRTVMHILFNMFTLFMFGPLLERVWGSRRFMIFYFVCGVGAAVVQELVWAASWFGEYADIIARANGLTKEHATQVINMALRSGDSELRDAMEQMKNSMVTVGASGAIFGLLLGFAFVFPNMPLYLFFIPVPIKAKYMVVGYAVLEFFLGVGSHGSTVAHFAHLGGMLFGLILLFIWKKKGTLHGNGFY